MKKYTLNHTSATVSLQVGNDRFICETKGKGAMDKLHTIDIPLSDIKNFCLGPVNAAQHLVTPGSSGDYSYDSEFIFTYNDNGKVKSKRAFVNSSDELFVMVLNELKNKRYDASLLHLPPAAALQRMKVTSSTTAMRIVLAILVGVPVLIALIFLVTKIFHT